VIGFRVARKVDFSGIFRLRSLLFAHFMRFFRSFSCANGSFSLLNERMKARTARVSRLLARCSSHVENRASGFQYRGAKLWSEKLYKIGILEACAELCACGNFRTGLVGKPLFNMARPGIIQNSKVILFNFSRHGHWPEYSRRGQWTRERSAREHPAGKNTTRGERTATGEARILNTVALAERSEALRRAHGNFLPLQLNKRSGADARCADARGARLNKRENTRPK
jgi:hypothetical protein